MLVPSRAASKTEKSSSSVQLVLETIMATSVSLSVTVLPADSLKILPTHSLDTNSSYFRLNELKNLCLAVKSMGLNISDGLSYKVVALK